MSYLNCFITSINLFLIYSPINLSFVLFFISFLLDSLSFHFSYDYLKKRDFLFVILVAIIFCFMSIVEYNQFSFLDLHLFYLYKCTHFKFSIMSIQILFCFFFYLVFVVVVVVATFNH